jgi:hypothetical protein
MSFRFYGYEVPLETKGLSRMVRHHETPGRRRRSKSHFRCACSWSLDTCFFSVRIFPQPIGNALRIFLGTISNLQSVSLSSADEQVRLKKAQKEREKREQDARDAKVGQ